MKILTLHKISEIYKVESEKAAKTNLSYTDYLLKLLEEQVLPKLERSINRKIQIAAFPQIKLLEEFGFSFQPQIDEKIIRELANLNPTWHFK